MAFPSRSDRILNVQEINHKTHGKIRMITFRKWFWFRQVACLVLVDSCDEDYSSGWRWLESGDHPNSYIFRKIQAKFWLQGLG